MNEKTRMWVWRGWVTVQVWRTRVNPNRCGGKGRHIWIQTRQVWRGSVPYNDRSCSLNTWIERYFGGNGRWDHLIGVHVCLHYTFQYYPYLSLLYTSDASESDSGSTGAVWNSFALITKNKDKHYTSQGKTINQTECGHEALGLDQGDVPRHCRLVPPVHIRVSLGYQQWRWVLAKYSMVITLSYSSSRLLYLHAHTHDYAKATTHTHFTSS